MPLGVFLTGQFIYPQNRNLSFKKLKELTFVVNKLLTHLIQPVSPSMFDPVFSPDIVRVLRQQVNQLSHFLIQLYTR